MFYSTILVNIFVLFVFYILFRDIKSFLLRGFNNYLVFLRLQKQLYNLLSSCIYLLLFSFSPKPKNRQISDLIIFVIFFLLKYISLY